MTYRASVPGPGPSLSSLVGFSSCQSYRQMVGCAWRLHHTTLFIVIKESPVRVGNHQICFSSNKSRLNSKVIELLLVWTLSKPFFQRMKLFATFAAVALAQSGIVSNIVYFPVFVRKTVQISETSFDLVVIGSHIAENVVHCSIKLALQWLVGLGERIDLVLHSCFHFPTQ